VATFGTSGQLQVATRGLSGHSLQAGPGQLTSRLGTGATPASQAWLSTLVPNASSMHRDLVPFQRPTEAVGRERHTDIPDSVQIASLVAVTVLAPATG